MHVARPVLAAPHSSHPARRLPWGRVLVAAALALTGALPEGPAWLLALLAVILLGVPHGALDGEVARPLLRPRLGRAWFIVFAAPYLALSALVLLAWHVAPLPTLAAFLACSALHFGAEDAGPDGAAVEVAVRGGLPIAAPVLLQSEATARFLGVVAGVPMAHLPGWLVVASWAWLALAIAWGASLLLRRRGRAPMGALVEPGLLAALFAALPPLSAFAIYFVCLHAPRHVAALAAHPIRAPRVHDSRSAVLRSLPVTALTLLIGAALWPFYAGPAPERLLALTLQGLAALTLPHLLLNALAERAEAARG